MLSPILRWSVPCVVAAACAVPDTALFAQGDIQGPLLLVPRSSIDRDGRSSTTSRGYRYDAPSLNPLPSYGSVRTPRGSISSDSIYGSSIYDRGAYGSPQRLDPHAIGRHIHGPTRFADPRVQQTSDWYRDLLGRSMTAQEIDKWQRHFAGVHPSNDDVALLETLGMILGSREFYNRVGGRFDDWIHAVMKIADRSASRDEIAHFLEDYRRSPDPVNFRVGFVRHLLADHAPAAIVAPDRRPGDRAPWYAQQVQHDHEHGHGHSHTTGYRPQGDGTGRMIQDWHTMYIGRQASGQEVRTLLRKHQQGGVSLDELRAGMIASPEWYARTGSRPERWVEATLKSLDMSTSRRSLERWNERHQRNNQSRYRTALEMLD